VELFEPGRLGRSSAAPVHEALIRSKLTEEFLVRAAPGGASPAPTKPFREFVPRSALEVLVLHFVEEVVAGADG
jgi:hypothetical protein